MIDIRARAGGSYPRAMNRLARIDVLVLDDSDMAPMSGNERRDRLKRTTSVRSDESSVLEVITLHRNR